MKIDNVNIEKKTVEREVTRTVTETVSEEVYSIELNREQVCALFAVLGAVGGSVDENNPRDVTDEIYWNLSNVAGINYSTPAVKKYSDNIGRSLRVGKVD